MQLASIDIESLRLYDNFHQGGIMATKTKRTKNQDVLPDTFSLSVRRTKDGWAVDAGRGAVESTGTFGSLQALTGALKTLARAA